MDKYKKLASNTIIFAIGTFSSKILSFLLMPFVTRMMTTGSYGAADLIQQTGNVIIPIAFLCVNSAATALHGSWIPFPQTLTRRWLLLPRT